jgi:hypothetical protein
MKCNEFDDSFESSDILIHGLPETPKLIAHKSDYPKTQEELLSDQSKKEPKAVSYHKKTSSNHHKKHK